MMPFLLLVSVALLQSAWAHDDPSHHKDAPDDAHDTVEHKVLPPPPPIVVRVTGYAMYQAPEKKHTDPKRLLAIRASKLDAYRNLAERVYGLSLAGSSTVKDFTLAHDGFETVVDSMIRGARVVSVAENKNTGIETVVELLLPGNFQDCLNSVNHFKYGVDCLQPLTAYHPEVHDRGVAGATASVTEQQVGKMHTLYHLK